MGWLKKGWTGSHGVILGGKVVVAALSQSPWHTSHLNRSRRWEHKTQTQNELGWLGTSIQLVPPSTPSHMAPIWPWTLPRYQFGVCSWRKGERGNRGGSQGPLCPQSAPSSRSGLDADQSQRYLARKAGEGSGNSFAVGIMVAKHLNGQLDTFLKGIIS